MLFWLDLQQELLPSPVSSSSQKKATLPFPKGTLAHENSRKTQSYGGGRGSPLSFPKRRGKNSPLGPWERVTNPGSLPSELAAGRSVEAKPPSGSSSPAGAGPSGPAALRGDERRGEAILAASRLPAPPAGLHPGTWAAAGSRRARRRGRREKKSGPRRGGSVFAREEAARQALCPSRASEMAGLWGAPGPRRPRAVSGRQFFSHSLI